MPTRIMGRVAQYTDWATGWMVRASNPGGGRDFPQLPDRPGGPPGPLYNGYGSFPGVKCGRGVLLNTHPIGVPWFWKSRGIYLPTLWATIGPVMGTRYIYYKNTREKLHGTNANIWFHKICRWYHLLFLKPPNLYSDYVIIFNDGMVMALL
jgi:hypothetical protein